MGPCRSITREKATPVPVTSARGRPADSRNASQRPCAAPSIARCIHRASAAVACDTRASRACDTVGSRPMPQSRVSNAVDRSRPHLRRRAASHAAPPTAKPSHSCHSRADTDRTMDARNDEFQDSQGSELEAHELRAWSLTPAARTAKPGARRRGPPHRPGVRTARVAGSSGTRCFDGRRAPPQRGSRCDRTAEGPARLHRASRGRAANRPSPPIRRHRDASPPR